MNPDTVLAILAMAVATYATRIGGMLVGALLPRTGRVKQAFDAVPVAVLTALIAPAVTSGTAEMVAGAVTVLTATRLPLIVAVAAGIACVALLRAIP